MNDDRCLSFLYWHLRLYLMRMAAMTGYDDPHLTLDCLQKHDNENGSRKEGKKSNAILKVHCFRGI